MLSEDEENLSDVKLDDDDEKLIHRVFYSFLGQDAGVSQIDQTNDGRESSREDSDEFSDLSDVDDKELINKYKELKGLGPNTNLSEQEKQRLIISNLSDDQMERFEAYRRMTVNKPSLKKVCGGVLGHSLPQNLTVVLAGLSKLFLGEIITRAQEVKERDDKAKLKQDIFLKRKRNLENMNKLADGEEIDQDDPKLVYRGDITSPLQAEHIREAWRLYRLENSSSFSSQWKAQGDSDGKMFR
ncbi:uncharacterized protein PRCAT00002177001 [Priceomyces carsonii]|uniref:uncharacterized protein n=1 Tax=Priceomyces carsonii TaxID=28549 RepID=UPI002EDA488A|nr:unnamed protein product [Priceomyces carsonii]